MSTLIFPTSAEIMEIAQQKMPRLTQDRPIFDIMPIRAVDEWFLLLEQLDDITGLQSVAGLNGEPAMVTPLGLSQYQIQPGVYREGIAITEDEMATRRKAGTFGDSIDLSDLIMQRQDQLLQRRLDRIEYIGWTVLATGAFAISNPQGIIMHQDAFPVQTYVAPVAWSNASTSAPLADLSAVQLLSRPWSVDLGAAATAYMNRGTFNNLRANNNAADMYGRRSSGYGTINDLGGINQLFKSDDLPQVMIYDQTYKTSQTSATTFIPDNTVIIIGKRPAGQRVAEYRMTRNAANPDLAPGPCMKVIDEGEIKYVRRVTVYDGHNGGPVIQYPKAVVILKVG